jgi:Predicted amidohydrolase
MKNLTVSLIQTNIVWQDPTSNRKNYEKEFEKLVGKTDLIVLPEMFTTAFTMAAEKYAEEMEGETMLWMSEHADKVGAAIVGSIIIKDRSAYYNRLIWMLPGGMYYTYDKRHLFGMAGEHQHYEPGEERLIVTHNGWRVCPMVCYDLRFPVWSRNDDSYDLLIYVANWPDKRSYDWKTLLKARAIENQSYVIGLNRIGKDHEGHQYSGDSCIIDPGWRKELYQAQSAQSTHTETLSYDHLTEVRTKLPFLNDQDDFKIL